VEVQVVRGETTGALDPAGPLALGEVAVEVEVDALGGKLGDRFRVEADRTAGDDGVDFAVVVDSRLVRCSANQSRFGRSPSKTSVGLDSTASGTTVANQSRISGLE
jgi:hypothetical protein